MVSGTAACTTTATPSSPAGDYPITCTVGHAQRGRLQLRDVRSGTLTVTYSGPVPDRQARRAADGRGRAGRLHRHRRGPGGPCDGEAGRLARRRGRHDHRAVSATGAEVVRLCGATLTGPVKVNGSTGLVLVGGRRLRRQPVSRTSHADGQHGRHRVQRQHSHRPAEDHRKHRARSMRPATRSAARSRSGHKHRARQPLQISNDRAEPPVAWRAVPSSRPSVTSFSLPGILRFLSLLVLEGVMFAHGPRSSGGSGDTIGSEGE